MALIRTLNLADADSVYAALAEAQRGLSTEQSAALHARLVLLLANHIGNADVIAEAIDVAKRGLAEAAHG